MSLRALALRPSNIRVRNRRKALAIGAALGVAARVCNLLRFAVVQAVVLAVVDVTVRLGPEGAQLACGGHGGLGGVAAVEPGEDGGVKFVAIAGIGDGWGFSS